MTNYYEYSDDRKVVYIFLTSDTYGNHTCEIDADDFEKVDSVPGTWRVHASNNRKYKDDYYVYTQRKFNGSKAKSIYMHRFLMDCPDDMEVDHGDFNGFNNKRDNLTVVTRQINSIRKRLSKNNTSGCRNVSRTRSKKGKPWRSEIRFLGKYYNLGQFWDKEDAAVAVAKFWAEHGHPYAAIKKAA